MLDGDSAIYSGLTVNHLQSGEYVYEPFDPYSEKVWLSGYSSLHEIRN